MRDERVSSLISQIGICRKFREMLGLFHTNGCEIQYICFVILSKKQLIEYICA